MFFFSMTSNGFRQEECAHLHILQSCILMSWKRLHYFSRMKWMITQFTNAHQSYFSWWKLSEALVYLSRLWWVSKGTRDIFVLLLTAGITVIITLYSGDLFVEATTSLLGPLVKIPRFKVKCKNWVDSYLLRNIECKKWPDFRNHSAKHPKTSITQNSILL